MYKYLLYFFITVSHQTNAETKTYEIITQKLISLPQKQKEHYASDIGSICEFIAREVVANKYQAKKYFIKSNIIYKNDRQNLGELDLVIFKNSTRKAVLILEVKCRTDREKAYQKGHQQLNRFKRTIREQEVNIQNERERYQPQRFYDAKTQVMMPKPCDDCTRSPWEFDITLNDIRRLQSELRETM